MITLALDTATPDTVVGAVEDGELRAERRLDPDPGGRPRHGPALLELVQEVIDEVGGWSRCGRIGVGVGPGSFTGIRIGVATARALAQARGLPIAGVVTAAALVAGVPGDGRSALAVIDARRGEVFAALRGAGEAEAGEPTVVAPELLATSLPGASGALAAGDGAVRFRGELEATGIEVLADGDPAHRLSARHVGALAEKIEAGAPEDVRPLYLRRPDAERWRKRDGRDRESDPHR